jgi:Na+-transporting methylmalonyl-CoA/oxaloacetate decarboxylase beta subunit
MEQQRSSQQKPFRVSKALQRLMHTAEELSIVQHLSDADKRKIADAVTILKTLQTTSKRRKYKLFLYRVLDKYGPHLVLLCAVGLGQVVVANMRKADRARLADLIGSQPQLANPALQGLAIKNNIPGSVNGKHLICI